VGEEADVRELVIEPLAAQSADDRDPPRGPVDRLENGQLRVGRVLVDERLADLDAGAAKPRQADLAE
jgi:hypothetical protein